MLICPQAFIYFSTGVTVNTMWHPFITGAQVRLWEGVCQGLPNWMLLPKEQDGSPGTAHFRRSHPTVPADAGVPRAVENVVMYSSD